METLLRDSKSVLIGLRDTTHSTWFVIQAKGRGHTVTGKLRKAKKYQVLAKVNHGRWLADCPFTHEGQPCIGAECVTEDDPGFLCLSCGNVDVGGDFVLVKFPPADQRHKFERSLALRPEALRNWLPGETPAKIAAENRKHGIPVPKGAE